LDAEVPAEVADRVGPDAVLADGGSRIGGGGDSRSDGDDDDDDDARAEGCDAKTPIRAFVFCCACVCDVRDVSSRESEQPLAPPGGDGGGKKIKNGFARARAKGAEKKGTFVGCRVATGSRPALVVPLSPVGLLRWLSRHEGAAVVALAFAS